VQGRGCSGTRTAIGALRPALPTRFASLAIAVALLRHRTVLVFRTRVPLLTTVGRRGPRWKSVTHRVEGSSAEQKQSIQLGSLMGCPR